MQTPISFVHLIDAWPKDESGRDVLAADLGVRPGLPPVWKHRGTIPACYWRDLVAAAKRREVPGVTFELLAGFAAQRREAA